MSETINLNSKNLLGAFTDPEYLSAGGEYFDSYWEWPQNLGNGFLGAIKLKPDLFLRIGKYKLNKKLFISFDMSDEYFNFWFPIQGKTLTRFAFSKYKNVIMKKPGSFSISYLPECVGNVLLDNDTPTEVVAILVKPSALRVLFGSDCLFLPEKMKSIIYKHENYFHQIYSATREIEFILREILFCRYKGLIRRVFLEGKAFELLSRAVGHISFHVEENKTKEILKQTEIEIIYRIKRIIEENIEKPLSLQALSREAGISHPKLNYCFKKLYGKTIFEHLRDIRLKKAKLLLDEGRFNVSGAAYEVGYTNLSYFTKSFKNHFGLNPGDYLKQVSSERY